IILAVLTHDIDASTWSAHHHAGDLQPLHNRRCENAGRVHTLVQLEECNGVTSFLPDHAICFAGIIPLLRKETLPPAYGIDIGVFRLARWNKALRHAIAPQILQKLPCENAVGVEPDANLVAAD